MKEKENYAAKIQGGYDSYVNMMIGKFSQCGIGVLSNEGPIGIIDIFDGSEHKNSSEGITSVTSFRSILFSHFTYKLGWTTNESRNILTWKQFIGKENCGNVLEEVQNHYEEKEVMI